MAALFAASVAIGVSVAWTSGVTGVASLASDLDEIDLALGSASVVRSAVSQAVVFSVNHQAGTASDEALAAAVSTAQAEITDYEGRLDSLQETAGPLQLEPLAHFSDSATSLVTAIATGVDAATAADAMSPLDAAYAAAVAELGAARTDRIEAIEAASDWPAWTDAATQVAATLAIPAVLAGAFWVVSRRKIRRSWAHAAAEIDDLEGQLAAANQAMESLAVRFRTPLTSVYGLSDVLAQKARRQGLDGELISLIHSESSELHRIADDALAATQLAAGTLEASASIVAFAEVIDEAVKPVRNSGLDIKVECPEIWVLTDAAKVMHILRNLVSNAAAHGQEPIFVEVSEIDGSVVCDVIDHGETVATAVRPDQVDFDPATGLGLKVAYSMAELIDAKLTHMRDGDRTIFSLSLADDDSEPRPGAPRRMARHMPKPLPAAE